MCCLEARIQQMIELHELILKKRTGTYRDMCKAMHMSKSNVGRLLETLRALGAIIEFDRILNTYYYVNDFELVFIAKTK